MGTEKGRLKAEKMDLPGPAQSLDISKIWPVFQWLTGKPVTGFEPATY
jgi:hypothetical protein